VKSLLYFISLIFTENYRFHAFAIVECVGLQVFSGCSLRTCENHMRAA